MIGRRLSMLAAVLLASVAPASAQLNFRHHPSKDPYRSLFGGEIATRDKPRMQGDVTTKNTPPQPQKPFVMCGTLVVPADPGVDPKIRVGPREDGVWDTMRVVKPRPCDGK